MDSLKSQVAVDASSRAQRTITWWIPALTRETLLRVTMAWAECGTLKEVRRGAATRTSTIVRSQDRSNWWLILRADKVQSIAHSCILTPNCGLAFIVWARPGRPFPMNWACI